MSSGSGAVTTEISVAEVSMRVWEADNAAERSQGLMDLDQLPDGVDGMLFTFSAPASATFTMENTLIPLDIWWFDSSGLVMGWTEMDLCDTDPCTRYRSPGLITWALETPAGMYQFEVGDLLSTGESA